MITAAIGDDEPLARQTLRRFLAEDPRFEVVGEAQGGEALVSLVNEQRPDVVFLDIEMPELSGVDAVARFAYDPIVVYTTAHERYAVAAFEQEALDYLVKPFGRRRFRLAIERVIRRMGERGTTKAHARAESAPGTGFIERVFVSLRGMMVQLQLRDVMRVEANDDYVTLWTSAGPHLANLSLGAFEQRLDPARFRRIHRRHIVNLDHVAAVRAVDARRLAVRFTDGSEIIASRAGSTRLRDLIV